MFTDSVVTMETTLPASHSAAEGQSVLQTAPYRHRDQSEGQRLDNDNAENIHDS